MVYIQAYTIMQYIYVCIACKMVCASNKFILNISHVIIIV